MESLQHAAEESKIAAALAAGDRDRDRDRALTLATLAYGQRIVSMAVEMGLTPETALDVRQQVLMTVLTRWAELRPETLESWVFTLARYEILTARSFHRRQAARAQRPTPPHPATPAPDDVASAGELADRISKMVDKMDPVNVMVVVTLARGDSDDEAVRAIQTETGVTLTKGALRVRRHRVRQSLARAIGLE